MTEKQGMGPYTSCICQQGQAFRPARWALRPAHSFTYPTRAGQSAGFLGHNIFRCSCIDPAGLTLPRRFDAYSGVHTVA